MKIFRTPEGRIVASVSPCHWAWLASNCSSVEWSSLAPREAVEVSYADAMGYSKIFKDLFANEVTKEEEQAEDPRKI